MAIFETNGKDRKPNEVSAWTVAIPLIRFYLNPLKRKRQDEAIQYIKTLDGFIGVYPYDPRGTLLLFRTKNDAKGARNLLKAKGCPVGDHICEIYVEKQYVPKEMQDDENQNDG